MARKRSDPDADWADGLEIVDIQEHADAAVLKKHGLDRPLRPQKFGGYDWVEIERQITYLIEHYDTMPRTTIRRRAVELLGCYQAKGEPLPGNMALLFGTLLDVSRVPNATGQGRRGQAARISNGTPLRGGHDPHR